MIALGIDELAGLVGGRTVPPPGDGADGAADAVVRGSVQTDSRLVEPGSIFFALPGETTDGALFAPAAVEAGAAVVIAERELDLPVPVIVVDDGVTALADLAREVVARVRSLGRLRVVGITGSNGKTTTKNLVAAILSEVGPTVSPLASFNNQVGAPISMLRVDESTEFLVVEMGASAPGEIARLVGIVVPDVSVALKVGLAHAGGFGGIEQTQREKSEIVRRLPASATAVLNADDPRVEAMAEVTDAAVVRFGLDHRAEVRAEDVRLERTGTSFVYVADGERTPVRLRILGEHHVSNALAALAVGRRLGVPRAVAVAAIEAVPRAERWRMEVTERADGVTVINDAYNASPDSTAAALRTLAQLTADGRRSVAVLGEMSELGEYADEEHDRLGTLVVRLDVKQLVVVGDGARRIHRAAEREGSWSGESILVEDPDRAYDVLRETLRPGDVVLVKSSNSAGLRFLGDRIAADGAAESEAPSW